MIEVSLIDLLFILPTHEKRQKHELLQKNHTCWRKLLKMVSFLSRQPPEVASCGRTIQLVLWFVFTFYASCARVRRPTSIIIAVADVFHTNRFRTFIFVRNILSSVLNVIHVQPIAAIRSRVPFTKEEVIGVQKLIASLLLYLYMSLPT